MSEGVSEGATPSGLGEMGRFGAAAAGKATGSQQEPSTSGGEARGRRGRRSGGELAALQCAVCSVQRAVCSEQRALHLPPAAGRQKQEAGGGMTQG